MPELSLNSHLSDPTVAFNVIGFPWDMGASLGRPGARYAPEVIRKLLGWNVNRIRDNKVWDIEGGRLVDLSKVRIADGGDVELAYHDRATSFDRVQQVVGEALVAGEVPIVLGGDHSISYPPIAALAEHIDGPVGIIQLDAHLDLVDDSPMQGRYSQSSQIRRALDLPNVSPERLIQIGIRGLNYPEMKTYCEEAGITQITAPEAIETPAEELAERAIAVAGRDGAKIYMTLDIDVITPMAAPGAGYLEFYGLPVGLVSKLLRLLAPHVAAFDVAEVNPVFDFKDVTSNLAAKLLFDFILGKVD
jgi:formiminoglutamase/agmatinase